MSGGQSKTGSLVESLANIAVGIGVAFISQEILFHAYGLRATLRMNAELTAWFTLISLVRQFVLRRVFNYFLTRRNRPTTIYDGPLYVARSSDGSLVATRDPWNNITRDGRCA